MDTVTTNGGSQTYSNSITVTSHNDIFQEELFVNVATALIAKWPTRTESDARDIARFTSSITKTLIEQYNRDFLNKER